MSTALRDFQSPRRIDCDKDTLTDRYGLFVAEPFERGFGLTIGNALRRVLLSSIEGTAVTSIKIEGIYHEFSTLPGVMEDVSDIVLNIKELMLKAHGDGPKKIYLKAAGPGEISASAIETGPDVEILNPDLHIATLDKEGKIDIEMTVRVGRGYVTAERQPENGADPQVIPMDAAFSPIRRVNSRVEKTRVGYSTDYDKLILEVWTNGAIHPQDAVSQAAMILKDHLQVFISFEEESEEEEPKIDEAKVKMAQNLKRSVEELELSVRAYNCLKNAEIQTIADLVQKTEAEMLKTRNFGRKSLNEIKEILAEMNLHLGMDLKELDLPEEVEVEEVT